MKATIAVALLLICSTADAKDNLRKNQAKPTPMKGEEARHLQLTQVTLGTIVNTFGTSTVSPSKGGYGACVTACIAKGGSNAECVDSCTPNGNKGGEGGSGGGGGTGTIATIFPTRFR